VFAPTKLERQAAILEQQPDVAFAFSLCGSFDQPDQPGHERQESDIIQTLLSVGRGGSDHVLVDQRLMFRLLFVHGNFVIGYPAFMFWRQLWETKGGIDERFRIASDFDFLCWLCQWGPAALVPESLFLRRSHGRNLSERTHVWTDIPDEIVVRRRCFERQSWLLQDRQSLRQVRARVIDMAAWLRVAGLRPNDFQVLWRWRLGDPGFASEFLDNLYGFTQWHCNEGDYGHAMRLVWHAARICGWNKHTWNVAREVVSHWLKNSANVQEAHTGSARASA
jgi:hypothetical protein